jgi:Lrp/AsnC family transcriptional regulator, leucine-responsive regulatory protein
VDDVDRRLLDALRGNARATYAELARAVGLSAPAAHDRVAKLESSGVITGYHAAVAPESLGYAINALIGVFLTDSADTDEITESLTALDVVEDCWFVAGEETFVIKVAVSDMAGLESTIRRLNAVRGIGRTRTTVVLSTKFENRVPRASSD